MLLAASRHNTQVVVQACAASQRAGVRAGMTVAHARALLRRDVIVETHQPEQDEAALRAIARWAIRFTPVVQVDSPDGVLLEITGCEHLHGGTRAMLRHVVEQTSRLGLQVRACVAPTVGCAWALARHGAPGGIVESQNEIAQALAPLPVRALRVDEEIVQALQAVAVERIGQLMELPRTSLAERFGEALMLRVDQALGQAFEAVEPIQPSEPLVVERTFDGPVKQLEGILETGRTLARELCDELAQREAGVRQLRVELQRIDAEDLQETLTLSRASRDARHLWMLLRPKLEQVHMGFGIERVALHATAVARLPHVQRAAEGWHDEAREPYQFDHDMAVLVDQLVARLGTEAVSVVEARPTHVPEQVFVHQPAREREVSGEAAAVVDADRPTMLYERPEPVQVVLLSPDGPVMSMSSGDEPVRIVSSVGPERVSPRWWLVGAADAQASPRDYYKVQDERGRWWWLYCQGNSSKWYVHGRWC